jgi:capsular exopolysaccharide synthesis family protein
MLSGNSDFLRKIQNLISHLILLDKSLPKSINIISTTPKEGATSVAVSLALSLSGNQRRVLLLDGSLQQKSGIADFFNVTLSKSIAAVLTGQMQPNEIIVPSGIEGISLSSLGQLGENFSFSMRMGELKKIMNSFGDDFDMVIIDSPPVSLSNNGVLFSQLMESTVFVVAAEAASIESVKNACGKVVDAGSKISGVVLNKLRT